MDMTEQDLSQLNQIDMECNVCDDDDDSFGGIEIKVPKNTPVRVTSAGADVETPDYNPHTGVIIDLSDGEDVRPMRHITADAAEDGIDVQKDFQPAIEPDPEGYNQIDMETDYYDDTEDPDYFSPEHKARPTYDFQDEEHTNGDHLRSSSQKTILDFDDDSDDLLRGLIDEDMLEEKKQITQGEVEADYWKKLQKKHAATNKKGAYNTHFHFAGNPKEEAEMFNHDMQPAGSMPTATNISGATGSDGASFGGGGEGCCEALEKDEPTKLLEELFTLIGFDVVPNSDGTLNAFDLCDENNDISANNLSNLIDQLRPYIDSCLICPLEVKTGKSFENYYDWCDWYNENRDRYPECARDIKYCDVLGNRLADCHF